MLSATQSNFDTIVTTDSVTTNLDVTRTIALKTTTANIAHPILQTLLEKNPNTTRAQLARIKHELTTIILLVSTTNLRALRHTPKLLGPKLETYRKLTLENAP
jgi:L-lactate dehydrogenase (FMN-dependent) and related alpha-hydroxy acid dehydrogenases